MLRPVFDEDVAKPRWPWLCLGLALLWVGVFAVSPSPARWGLLPDAVGLPGLLCFPLLHVNGVHLSVSLVLLALVGPALEDRWGRPFFAGFALACVWLGGGVYALATTDSERPLVGPSALLAGLAAAAVIRFLRPGLRFAYTVWFRDWIRGSFWTPAVAIAPLWFVGEVLLESFAGVSGPTRGINYSAHLFSAALGAGCAALLMKTGAEERVLRRGIANARSLAAEQVLEQVRQARDEGRSSDAYELLAPALVEHPHHAGLAVAFWATADECGRQEKAWPLMLRFVERNVKDAPQAAAEAWRAILDSNRNAELDLRLRLALAPVLQAEGHPRAAALTLRGGLTNCGRPLSPGMALRFAELARTVHPPTAIEAARRALEAEGLDETKRARIEGLIDAIEGDPANLELPELADDLDDTEATPAHDEPAGIAFEDDGDDLSRPPPDLGPPPEPREEPSDFDDPRALDLGDGSRTDDESVELSADGSLVASDGDLMGMELDPSELTAPAAPLAAAPTPPLEVAASDPQERRTLPLELPPPPDPNDWSDEIALDATEDEPRFVDVKVIEATPRGIDGGALMLVSDDKAPSPLDLSRIEAVAVAAIEGLAARPVLVIDLLLNWTDCGGGPLKIARLRSDRFDPRPLAPEAGDPVEAVRSFTAALLDASGAIALPDPDAARGRPFQRFASLEAYQRDVLGVGA